MAFHDDIILQEVSSGLFATEIIEDYWIIVGPNGGYLGALITNAAEMHLEREPYQLRYNDPLSNSSQIRAYRNTCYNNSNREICYVPSI